MRFSKKNIYFLALGDSYTIGEGVGKNDSWPAQLRDELQKKENVSCRLTVVATTGWRTDELHQALEKRALKKNIAKNDYSLVSLLIGVNDQFQNKSIHRYEENFESLLQRAIQIAGDKATSVVCISIPDYGYTPFGRADQLRISPHIDHFNRANKAVATKYGVLYCDITDISRKGFVDQALITSDGLHPSPKQYALWVRRIMKIWCED